MPILRSGVVLVPCLVSLIRAPTHIQALRAISLVLFSRIDLAIFPCLARYDGNVMFHEDESWMVATDPNYFNQQQRTRALLVVGAVMLLILAIWVSDVLAGYVSPQATATSSLRVANYQLELRLAPSVPRVGQDFIATITIQPVTGMSPTHLTITYQWTMPAMAMRGAQGIATPSDAAPLAIPLVGTMSGSWQLTLIISASGASPVTAIFTLPIRAR